MGQNAREPPEEVAKVRKSPLGSSEVVTDSPEVGLVTCAFQRWWPKMVDGRRRWESQRNTGGDGQQPEMGVVAESGGEERRE